MTTITLSKPITAHGETLSELTFREPTVKDLTELGYPFKIVQGSNGAGVELVPKVILAYTARLAAVNPASLDSLSMGDFSRIQAVILGFFGDELEEATATLQP